MLKKFISIFVVTAIVASQAAAAGAPPIDVNIAVTNPNLVAAMERLKTDTSDGAKDALLLELNQQNYLVAIFADDLYTSGPDENGESKVEEDSTIKVISTSDGNGNMYLPLFTDWETLTKYIDQPVIILVFPPQDAWYWTLKMGKYHGVVINPGENALPLNKGLIQYLASQLSADEAKQKAVKQHFYGVISKEALGCYRVSLLVRIDTALASCRTGF